MKDIDFDELDRAVNSLMNSVPKDDDGDDGVNDTPNSPAGGALQTAVPAQNDISQDMPDDEIQLAPPAELMIVDEPEVAEAKAEPAPSVPASPAATSLPPVRRGKFMDMVRSPARDAEKTAPSTMPSRHAPTLQPITPQTRPAPTVAAPSPASAVPANSWQVEESLQKELEATLAPSSPTSLSTPEVGPPVLPFLPDAKVEKRPLGRPVEPQLATSTSDVPQSSSPLAPVDLTASTQDDTDTGEAEVDAQLPGQPLPAELGSELLSIETSTDMLPPETPVSTMPPQPLEPAPSPSAHIPGVARPSAATSIPQQYTVQPKETTDQEPGGAIYDAATYHQPLVHLAKKKPGWVWVVAIIVILLLGITGGAAVYYFGLGG